ncbi:MAG: hypothetical protein N2689_01735 [Verrucomicrobiae bacterium]|nr:hypothetical protein [Verrucomicrobiae bacterium]
MSALLSEVGAKYLICGEQACILHGLIRTTEDVDILVEEKIPYLGLQALIASKETCRQQDQVDVARLRQLAQR